MDLRGRKGLDELAELLAGTFYLFMGVAVLALLTASPGVALTLLILGSCFHVGREGVEGLASSREPRGPDLERSLRRAEVPDRPTRAIRLRRDERSVGVRRS